ncbi:unnamed protein product [Notodromas monacha]|uniref:Uncharacterized protein n=1 Tax=Notodromas monacha TaxID=399045 RepID=A0A7R9BEK6_9CRUS|nr:unnamed protein product [Notodromas monacha]CAG0912340.1 unnamed protein product [Notodromas monacha]
MGRKGDKGDRGRDGQPGVQTYALNDTEVTKILVPPKIIKPPKEADFRGRKKPMVLYEGENLRLACAASGQPEPVVEWTRTDGQPFRVGKWTTNAVLGKYLNLTEIHRDHMGEYKCSASNGIPPDDEKKYDVEVHFPPYIEVRRTMVPAPRGFWAFLVCDIETYPEAVTYWERGPRERGPRERGTPDERGSLIAPTDTYVLSVTQKENSKYKFNMTLNITSMKEDDYRQYRCVASNLRGLTKGILTVHEVSPDNFNPVPYDGEKATFGHRPDHVGYEDLCPPPPDCPKCKPTLCSSDGSRVSYAGITGSAFGNYSNAAHPKRLPTGSKITSCVLTTAEIPTEPVSCRDIVVTERSLTKSWNAMGFSAILSMIKLGIESGSSPKKTRNRLQNTQLDATALRAELNVTSPRNLLFVGKSLSLTFSSSMRKLLGSSHVIYKGSFFYQTNDQNSTRVARYDLKTGIVTTMIVPEAEYANGTRLYSSRHSFFDFNVDENGIWVIYGLRKKKTIVVVKFDPTTMQIDYAWNVTLEHHKVGDMFIVCGVLYAVDSLTEGETKIRFALDLYYHQLLSDVDLTFSNPFRQNTMEIISWDNGNQLAYPIKYTSSGDEDSNGPDVNALQEPPSKDGFAFAG